MNTHTREHIQIYSRPFSKVTQAYKEGILVITNTFKLYNNHLILSKSHYPGQGLWHCAQYLDTKQTENPAELSVKVLLSQNLHLGQYISLYK